MLERTQRQGHNMILQGKQQRTCCCNISLLHHPSSNFNSKITCNQFLLWFPSCNIVRAPTVLFAYWHICELIDPLIAALLLSQATFCLLSNAPLFKAKPLSKAKPTLPKSGYQYSLPEIALVLPAAILSTSFFGFCNSFINNGSRLNSISSKSSLLPLLNYNFAGCR